MREMHYKTYTFLKTQQIQDAYNNSNLAHMHAHNISFLNWRRLTRAVESYLGCVVVSTITQNASQFPTYSKSAYNFKELNAKRK